MQHRYKPFLVFVILLTAISLQAQKPRQASAGEIYQSIKKLNVLGNVLYLAAHPDDENQRLIGYMANKELVNSAYLALTRGDGGQNLIGPELREGLGVIRTQELLAARRVDGSKQFFTRANDFGYSKNPEETLTIWDKDKVLHDMVWVIREFRPDVIITRFPPDGGGGHGHHTSSAILAEEAFDLAADATAYPEQLKTLEVWQPKRLLLNTGRWWNNSITADTEGVVTLNVGEYNSLLGASYNEIAARSRSQHQSQGFGATGSRGEQIEFLEHKKGDQAEESVFDGIDLSWSKVKGGEAVQSVVNQVIQSFDLDAPEKSIAQLIKAKKAIIENVTDEFWKPVKLKEIDELLIQCTGLYLEAAATDYYASPSDEVDVKFEAINRVGNGMVLKKLVSSKFGIDSILDLSFETNERVNFDTKFSIPKNTPYSQPYWLVNEGTDGTYAINDEDAGKGENDPAVVIKANIEIDGESLTLDVPVIYKWNDPVKGEQYRPFNIIPAVSLNVSEQVLIFKKGQQKSVSVIVKSARENIVTTVRPVIPAGWTITPTEVKVDLEQKGAEQQLTFNITSPNKQETVELAFEANLNGEKYNQSLQEIIYDHIPAQIILSKAATKLVNIDVQIVGSKIAYIHGAGDAVPQGLRNMGYQVDELENGAINLENLKNYDAVVLGIRAVNTDKRFPFYKEDLMKYAELGGTLVMQYNTRHRLTTQEFSPYPIKLSRDRVTLETAEVRTLLPKHEVLNSPNKITNQDFDGWVQERGLYFPSEWDEKYAAVLSSNDPNEPPRDGSLLVTSYGKGHYVYTGLSFFREIPAGVPGAYRLLANIVSLSK